MTLPYYVRLLCLCFASFYVAHAAVWLLVQGSSRGILRIAETMRPKMSARWLFAARVSPMALTVFLVLGFCIPSYLWLEPEVSGEHVGLLCLGAAALGVVTWLAAIGRGVAAIIRTEQYIRRWGRTGNASGEVLVICDDAAIMAVAGVAHPRLVVSQSVIDALSEEQRDVAFRHERAHRASRDNLKKLFLLLLPDVVPFVSGLASLERGWMRFTEWAADDEAVDGSQERALSLASALVRVAKLGVHRSPACLLSTLVEDDRDLATRVDRLLREPAYAEKPLQPLLVWLRNAALTIGCIGATLLLWPQSLGGIHRLLERLVQ